MICDAGAVQVSFRNNFNFQDGIDGGVLEVSYDHGLTFQEIADLVGCPLSTVKTRLYQGLTVLRRELAKSADRVA